MQYQQALQEAQGDREAAKKAMVALEVEKAKLTLRLGKKNAGDASLEPLERTNRALERILERPSKIEKRLDKIER